MKNSKYLDSFVKDTFKVKYYINSETYLGRNRYVLVTDKNHIISIIENPMLKDEINRHIEWLTEKNKQSQLNRYIEFPRIKTAFETDNHIGFISNRTKGIPLRYYCTCPIQGKRNMQWFSETTQGFSKRIDIGIKLINALQAIHSKGYTLSDMSPDTILVSEQNDIKFTESNSMSSSSHKAFMQGLPYYSDPTVTLGMGTPSIKSDTYTCAIILFELLMSRHPFLDGDIKEKVYDNKLISIIDTGEQNYLFEYEIPENDTLFLTIFNSYPTELKNLFCDMFTIGKLNVEARPSLEDFLEELTDLKNKILVCRNCNNEFIATSNECPFCWEYNPVLIVDYLETITTTKAIVLMETHQKPEMKPIPPTSNIKKTIFLDKGICDINLDLPNVTEESNKFIKLEYMPNIHNVKISNLCKDQELKITVPDNGFSAKLKHNKILTLNVGDGLIMEIIPEFINTTTYDSSIYGNITITPKVQIKEVY